MDFYTKLFWLSFLLFVGLSFYLLCCTKKTKVFYAQIASGFAMFITSKIGRTFVGLEMVCLTSCMISAIFVIGMIYFYTMTGRSQVVQQYRSTLSPDLLKRYDNIAKERMTISCEGYGLGFLFSLLIIYYHSKMKMSTTALVCTVIATASVTNYFYYMLHKKSDWMLHHIDKKRDVENWLTMYRTMSYHYHSGLALGIVAVALFAFAFRC